MAVPKPETTGTITPYQEPPQPHLAYEQAASDAAAMTTAKIKAGIETQAPGPGRMDPAKSWLGRQTGPAADAIRGGPQPRAQTFAQARSLGQSWSQPAVAPRPPRPAGTMGKGDPGYAGDEGSPAWDWSPTAGQNIREVPAHVGTDVGHHTGEPTTPDEKPPASAPARSQGIKSPAWHTHGNAHDHAQNLADNAWGRANRPGHSHPNKTKAKADKPDETPVVPAPTPVRQQEGWVPTPDTNFDEFGNPIPR